jgi:hypothetical protein
MLARTRYAINRIWIIAGTSGHAIQHIQAGVSRNCLHTAVAHNKHHDTTVGAAETIVPTLRS